MRLDFWNAIMKWWISKPLKARISERFTPISMLKLAMNMQLSIEKKGRKLRKNIGVLD
jgi:hypothetical protein